jgi:hypothetical protein
MKLRTTGALASALTFGMALAASSLAQAAGGPLTAKFTDPKWGGDKVPAGQQCKKFGGAGMTPAIEVSGLPSGTTAIVLAFNDETYQPMNNGGHGMVRFAVAKGATSAKLAPAPGETDDLPSGVTKEAGHRASAFSGTGGAYLPPCSGGQGNTYTVSVKAMGEGAAVLGETKLALGKY